MPRVPTYDLPQVLPEAPQQPQVSPDMFGAAQARGLRSVAEGLGDVGNTVQAYVMREQELANHAEITEKVMQRDRMASDSYLEFTQLRGKEASDAYPRFVERIDAINQEILNSTTNPAIRRSLQTAMRERYDNELSRMASHAKTQLFDYQKTQYAAVAQTQIELAGRDPDDTQAFGRYLVNQETALREGGRLAGLPPEMIQLQIMEGRSKIVDTRIRAKLAEGDHQTAKRLFDQYRDSMQLPDAVQLEEVINARYIQDGADQIVAAAMAGKQYPVGSGPVEVSPIGQLISKVEGTSGDGGYNTTLANGLLTDGPVNLTQMTLDEVDAMQQRMLKHPKNRWNSSAAGKYQIVRKTLKPLRERLGLKGHELYDEAMQERLFAELLKDAGGTAAGVKRIWQGAEFWLNDEQIEEALAASRDWDFNRNPREAPPTRDTTHPPRPMDILAPQNVYKFIKSAIVEPEETPPAGITHETSPEDFARLREFYVAQARASGVRGLDKVVGRGLDVQYEALVSEHRRVRAQQLNYLTGVISPNPADPTSRGVTSYGELPPQAKEIFDALPAKEQETFRKQWVQQARGDTRETMEQAQLFARYRHMARDPTQFEAFSRINFFGPEYNLTMDARKTLEGFKSQPPRKPTVNISAIMGDIEFMLPDDLKGRQEGVAADRQALFEGRLSDEIERQQAATGKQLDMREVRKIAADLLTRKHDQIHFKWSAPIIGSWTTWRRTDTRYAFEPSGEQREAAVEELRNELGDEPEEFRVNEYLRLKAIFSQVPQPSAAEVEHLKLRLRERNGTEPTQSQVMETWIEIQESRR